MNRHIVVRVKLAMLKQQQAALHQRGDSANRRQAWRLYTEAAAIDQSAYTIFVKNDGLTLAFDSKPMSEERNYLTERVRLSSQRLIETNQCHNLSDQLAIALDGLSLVSTTQPHLFFGQDRICATYGRIFDELKQLDPVKARQSLNNFHQQCVEMTRRDDERDLIQCWIGNERERLKGKPMLLIGLNH